MSEDFNKLMISLSTNIAEANDYIENLGFLSLDDKIRYLNQLFNVKLISKKNTNIVTLEEEKKMDYYALLNTILLMDK